MPAIDAVDASLYRIALPRTLVAASLAISAVEFDWEGLRPLRCA